MRRILTILLTLTVMAASAQYKENVVRMATSTAPFKEAYYPPQLIRVADSTHLFALTHAVAVGQTMKTVFDSGWYRQIDNVTYAADTALPYYIVSLRDTSAVIATKYPREALIAGVPIVSDTAGWDTLCTGLTVYSTGDNTMWEHQRVYDSLGNQTGCEWVDVSSRPIIPNPDILTNGVYSDTLPFNNAHAIGALRPITIDTVQTGSRYKVVFGVDTVTNIATKYYVDSIFLKKLDTINNPWMYLNGYVVLRDINDNVGIGTNAPTARLDVNANALINGVKVGRSGVETTTTIIGREINIVGTGLRDGATAIGHRAMYSGYGQYSTAVGREALKQGAPYSTAIGAYALQNAYAGINNTAIGFQALRYNTSGASNFAIGLNALINNISGSNNVAVGSSAGSSQVSGSNNIYLGRGAGYYDTTSNKLYIHNQASDSLSATIYADMKNTSLLETPRIRLNGEVMVKSLDTLVGTANYVVVNDATDPNRKKLALQQLGDCPTSPDSTTAGLPLYMSGKQVNIYKASTTDSGYLSATDWNVFNNKVSSRWGLNGSDIYYNTGKVGIGTTAPGYALDVSGGTIATSSVIAITGNLPVSAEDNLYLSADNNNNDANRSIIFGSNNTTATTEFARFAEPNGNLGIGTTAPAYKLDVSGTARVTAIAVSTTDTTSVGYPVGTIQMRITAADTSAWLLIRTDGSITARWKKLTP